MTKKLKTLSISDATLQRHLGKFVYEGLPLTFERLQHLPVEALQAALSEQINSLENYPQEKRKRKDKPDNKPTRKQKISHENTFFYHNTRSPVSQVQQAQENLPSEENLTSYSYETSMSSFFSPEPASPASNPLHNLFAEDVETALGELLYGNLTH